MKTDQRQIGTVDVFTPTGPLVEADGEEFTKLLLDRLRSANPRVVVSMKEVSHMDSVALEGLLAATGELADRATCLKLAALTPTCREILELTGLSGRFQFFECVNDAVRRFL